MMRNQKGFITVDFIFTMVLILGLTSLLFVLTFTLTIASVTQYITFASARNYVVAHLDQEQQNNRAIAKYKELTNLPVFKPLYNNGWFKIDAEPNVGDHTKIVGDFASHAGDSNQFYGVGTGFTAAVLEFKIPIFGSTQPDGDGSGEGFKTYIGSYMGREPTTDECLKFTSARWSAIRNMTGGGSSYSTNTTAQGYYTMTDDGC